MATASILNLGVQIGLTGNEWLEIANMSVNGSQPTSRRVTAAALILLAGKIAPVGPAGVAQAVPAAGANNDYNASGLMGPLIGFLDLSPTADCNITGLAAGYDGQVTIVSNLTAFKVTLNALNAGSSGVNQFRMGNDLDLTQNNGQAFKYSATIGKWVQL